MAEKCGKLIGVEIVPDAVSDARENAYINSIRNCEFFAEDAAGAAVNLRKRGVEPDVVVIDPPRKGCDSRLIATVVQMAPKRIVYVSCDPETLARDLRVFADSGYTVDKVAPVDMFSRTPHIECVVLLTRKMPENDSQAHQ